MRAGEPRQPGIYVITNTINGKQYVGQAKDIAFRWWGHRNLLRRGRCHSRHLQNAWDKYGEVAFRFEVLEIVDDLALLDERECHWASVLQPAYTTRLDPVTNRGIKHTAESIARMTAARKAKWGYVISDATREKWRAAFKGRKQTPEAVAKRLAAVAVAMRNPAVGQKISAAKHGIPRSPETIEKVRRALTGRKITGVALEHLRAAAEVRRGRKYPGTGLTGESNPKRKLTWDQVRDIRRLYAEGVVQTVLAKQFGVAQGIISSIVRGLLWKDGDAGCHDT